MSQKTSRPLIPRTPEQRRIFYEDALYDAGWMWYCGDRAAAQDLLYQITKTAVPERIRITAAGVIKHETKVSQTECERGA